MSFRRRTYPEVLDNLLTDITGGEAAESHPFPPPGASGPPYQHTLLKAPAASVISVYGSRDDKPHLFAKDKDYKLTAGRTLDWQKGAELPDPGTLVHINYYPKSADPVLTDIQTGSVVRTLAESVALEMASLSAQLDAVYKSAFIDTASGKALENVVSLLGVARVSGGRAVGDVEFTRAAGSSGSITIPAGTRVSTTDVKISYTTSEPGLLADGQSVARVPARDLDAKNDPVAAGMLTLLAAPIAGVGSVSNPSPTSRLMRDESDDELRTRAKSFLHGSERATLGSIRAALAGQGVAADVDESTTPGYVDITPHTTVLSPEARQRLLSVIDAVRPAGVVVRLKDTVPPTKVNLSLRLTTSSNTVQKDLKAIQRAVREKVADYFSKLPAKEPGSVNRLVGAVQSVAGVEDLKILSATRSGASSELALDMSGGQLGLDGLTVVLGNLQLTDPNLPTTLSIVATYPNAAAPADSAAIQKAAADAISYLNNLNSTELPANASTAEKYKRKVSFGKLLLATPLPGKPAIPISSFDNPQGQPPVLPTDAGIAPYKVQFVITGESGFSTILARSTDAEYLLSPLERLSLSLVQVQVEGSGA